MKLTPGLVINCLGFYIHKSVIHEILANLGSIQSPFYELYLWGTRFVHVKLGLITFNCIYWKSCGHSLIIETWWHLLCQTLWFVICMNALMKLAFARFSFNCLSNHNKSIKDMSFDIRLTQKCIECWNKNFLRKFRRKIPRSG